MEDFIKERNEVFTSMDKEKILEYCKKYDITIPENEEIFWAGVHKVICNLFMAEDTTITIEQYDKSFDWLTRHGYSPSID